ncbi:GNAT family N-acetyltransferase [Paracraurococcus lichenis]|uniref:GNAT family N-acetyltransferase n=1 Tax=Paracraurococcus lichenis TaxID=3064888 RepID=A0ABT9DT06_9PROT|nr:GNAT family N-acetyltransferase [Paracraurococcus sp. LOR1-02]MDO9707026.1 GNAT family N-acetyltransferase [Paracraurococcus sp. LOR1-02]
MSGWRLEPGWVPGAIGDIAALHARVYAESHGFGPVFEAKVARELGEFLARLDPARDLFRGVVAADGRLLGSIALDGGEPGLSAGTAHLRWFILDAALRGSGLGRRLLAEALTHARAVGFARVYLWTLAGLPAAERLYAEAGFALEEEVTGTQWGRPVTERRLGLALPAGDAPP